MTPKHTLSMLLITSCFLASSTMVTATVPESVKPTSAATVEKNLIAQNDKEMKKAADHAKTKIVAKVEGADISMFELVRMMNRVASAFYSGVDNLTPEINEEIRERALERLIFEELAIREAVRQDIVIAPEKIDKVIEETQKLYPGEGEFQQYLNDRGITEKQLRAKIERTRLLQGITGREVYQKSTIDEKDIERLYKDYIKLGKLKTVDEFFAKEILLLPTDNKEQAALKAQELLGRLMAYNYDFGRLVLDGSFIVRNVRVKKDKLPVIYKAMKTMEVGEFSKVVEDEGTFHIFKVLKNKPGRDMTKEEARGILEDRLATYSQNKRKTAWEEELKKDAEITIYKVEVEALAK
jgi:parvulin-like peptidyl-prolyl isomerase